MLDLPVYGPHLAGQQVDGSNISGAQEGGLVGGETRSEEG